MPSLTIEGVPGYDGEYPLDLSYFTNRELHLIKELSGVRAGELEEAFEAGDNDLMVALAAIAVTRKRGSKPNLDALWDAPAAKLTLNADADEEGAEGDDESLPPQTEPDDDATSRSASTSDGLVSGNSSAPPESDLRRIGVPV